MSFGLLLFIKLVRDLEDFFDILLLDFEYAEDSTLIFLSSDFNKFDVEEIVDELLISLLDFFSFFFSI